MDQFFKLTSAGQKAVEKRIKLAQGESPWQIAHEQVQQEQQATQQEDSTEIVARKIAEATGKSLDKEKEESRPSRPLHLRHPHGRRLWSLRRADPRSHHRRRHSLRHPSLPRCRRGRRPRIPTLPRPCRHARASTTSSTGPPTSSTEALSNSSAASSGASFRPAPHCSNPASAIACLLESTTA